MYRNAIIVGIGSYHPSKIIDNQYYIDHFKQYDLDESAASLMDKLGRDTRTIAHEDETSITMGVEAALEALKNANLTPNDIDAIISVSDTPEFLTPCCALVFKDRLKAENVTNVFDMNNNCIGMITGVDIAARYIKTDKKYKRIMVIGSLLMSPFAREDDPVTYGCIADGSSAIILEAAQENEERGVLGSRMFTDSTYNETIRFPACGLSKVPEIGINSYNKKIEWKRFDFSFLSDRWSNLITELLDEHESTPKDISHYFLSQFSKYDLELTLEKLGENLEKATFIGDKYGYTGCVSPFMALDDRLKEEKFNRDDLIIFCSVAAGYSMVALLYKW